MDNLKPAELELLATCAGFNRAVLQVQSYEWAEKIFVDINQRGAAVAVKAANGAGKTSRVASGVALWNASVFPGSLTIATAGVFRQVKEQLFSALHSHAHKFSGWQFNDCETKVAHLHNLD